MNANLDMIVSAVDLLKALDMDITLPCDHSNLSSTTELEQLVAFSMLHCAGIERVFTHQSLFDTIVNIAASLPHVVRNPIMLCLMIVYVHIKSIT